MTRGHLARATRRAGSLAIQQATPIRRRSVVYDSFHGGFSDSPRAIYEELIKRSTPFEHTWTQGPRPAEFPPASRVIEMDSVHYLRSLGAADFIVVNRQMPRYLHKKRRATYLQTWHGTPLKRIGFDNPQWRANPDGFRDVEQEVKRWDVLLSQNRFSTDIFRHAFRFEGEILETGYPRNDVLLAADRDATRLRVRRQLGIDADARVVLYAPTFRDTDVDARGRPAFSLRLDLTTASRHLADDHVLLLRLHYAIPADRVDQLAGDFVRDVSAHPDIRELYLAADLLVTDYSSAMFDFAVTGKPILLYTYDLDAYRNDVRGFYFDIADGAPGPILTSTDGVVEAIVDLHRVTREYAQPYAAFRERFCHLDDGHASARVVDRVFAAVLA